MGADAVVFTKGDVDAARAQAAVRVEQTYVQAARHHNTMETSGTVARWDGDRVTLWDAVQAGSTVIPVVSKAFGIDAAERARRLPAHRRRLRRQGLHLAARDPRRRGRPGGGAAGEAAPAPGRPVLRRRLPAVDGADDPARRRRRRGAARRRARRRQQRGAGRDARRARHGGEQVALRLAVDPAAPGDRAGLAQRADADARPRRGAGSVGVGERDERARRRGRDRPPRPAAGQLRRGVARGRQAVVEQPAAGGVRGGRPPLRLARPPRAPAAGRAVADRARDGHLLDGQLPLPRRRAGAPAADGGAVVESNVHDIGSGAQTVLAQIAAEELGLPLDRVAVRWGDTDLPRTGPTYGSSTTMGTGSAVAAAARDVTKQLADLGHRRRPDGRRQGSTSSSARARTSCPAGRCSTATARARPTPCAPGARSSSRWASTRTSACCGCGARSASTRQAGSSTRSRRGRRWSARSSGAGARRRWRRATRSRCTAGGWRRTCPMWPCRSTPTSRPTSTCRSSTSSTRRRA